MPTPPGSGLRSALHAAHVCSLGLWFGGLVMTGAAAAIVFPTMKGLKPVLPEYSGYSGDHWMLAAGHVAARVFAVSDAVAFVCATVAGLTMLIGPAVFGQQWRSGLYMTRACVLGGALCALAYQMLVLAPRMQTNLRNYWDRALAGGEENTKAAEAFRVAFSAEHPTAQLVMTITTILVLIGLALSALRTPTVTESAMPGYIPPVGGVAS